MTARDMTRFCAFFLRPEIGQFSPRFGAISLPNHTETWKKRKKSKIQWRNFPEIADFRALSWRTRPDFSVQVCVTKLGGRGV